jgi:hypothetical protein
MSKLISNSGILCRLADIVRSHNPRPQVVKEALDINVNLSEISTPQEIQIAQNKVEQLKLEKAEKSISDLYKLAAGIMGMFTVCITHVSGLNPPILKNVMGSIPVGLSVAFMAKALSDERSAKLLGKTAEDLQNRIDEIS